MALFKTDIKLKVNYNELVERLKKRLNKTFFKGFFDRERSVLYYHSSFIKSFNFQQIPSIKIEIFRVSESSELTIIFKVVNLIPIIFISIHIFTWLMLLAIINTDGLSSLFPGLVLPIFSIGLLGIIQFGYQFQLDAFKKEIAEMEIEIKERNKIHD